MPTIKRFILGTMLALSLAGENDMICVTGSLFIAAGAIEQAMILGLKSGTNGK